MARIFISYSRTDEPFARRLAESLSGMGADVWIDVEDIPVGMKWSSAIQQGLDSGELLIIIISPESMQSRNVEDEWQYYIDHAKPVVPVLLRPAKIHFQLNRLQYIDFNAQAFDIAINQLYAELRRKGLSLDAPAQPQPPTGHTLPNFDRLSPEEIDRALAELQVRRKQFDSSAAVPYPPPAQQPRQPTPNAQTYVGGRAPGYTPLSPQPKSSNRLLMVGAGGVGLILVIGIIGLLLQGLGGGVQPTPPPESPADNQQATSIAATQIAQATINAVPSMTDAPAVTIPPTATFPPPGLSADNPVPQNNLWSPVIRTFNNMEMALVPTGRFIMGTSQNDINALYHDCDNYINNCRGSRLFDDESPQVEVVFDQPFWIGRYEVTNGQYGSPGDFAGDNMPRTNVTWLDAQNFCERLGMRLPTEREWEYASRGPDNLAYPWGNEFPGAIFNYCDASCNLDVAWKDTNHNDGYPEVAPVGALPNSASWVGAQDMAGNVWEWTSTIYRQRPADGFEDRNRDEPRTLKGSSWNWILHEGRAAARSPYAGNNTASPWYGFRCAKDFNPADL